MEIEHQVSFSMSFSWDQIVGILLKTALGLVCTFLIVTAVKLLKVGTAAQSRQTSP